MWRGSAAVAIVFCAAVLLLLTAGDPSQPTGGRGQELLSGAQRQSAQRILQKLLRAESLSQRADSDDKIKVYDAAAARKEAGSSSPLTRIFGFGPFGEDGMGLAGGDSILSKLDRRELAEGKSVFRCQRFQYMGGGGGPGGVSSAKCGCENPLKRALPVLDCCSLSRWRNRFRM